MNSVRCCLRLLHFAALLLAVSRLNFSASITVAWDPNPDPNVAGYNLYFRETGAAITNKLNVLNVTNTTISSLQAGATYEMFVTAYCVDGIESEPSNAVTYSTPAPTINTAPTLATVPNQTTVADSSVSFTAVAMDADVPAQTLTFSLGSGAPTGAAINALTGVFMWQPTSAQAPSTNLITIVVTDNGVPALSATKTFTVIVNPVIASATLYRLKFGSYKYGTVNYTPTGVASQGAVKFAAGTLITFTAVPQGGAMFTEWNINGSIVRGNPLSTAITSNLQVTPKFRLTSSTAATEPTLTMHQLEQGLFVSVDGAPGSWSLETSSDLASWTPLATGLGADEVDVTAMSPGFFRLAVTGP